jgi:hypothetical protein
LELNLVSKDNRKIIGKLALQQHAISSQFGLSKRKNLLDSRVNGEWLLGGWRLFNQSPHACDYVASPIPIANDALNRLPRFGQIRGITSQPAQTRVGVS